MKIEHSTKPTGSPLVKETRVSAKKANPASDEVELSRLASLLATPEDEAPFDTARVAEIKQAISEGRFSIDASAIADRLIVSARELIDSGRSS